MRTKLLTLLMTVSFFMLAACGAPAPTSTSQSSAPVASSAAEMSAAPAASAAAETSSAATSNATTIRIALVDYKDEHKTWLEQEVIPSFQKDNPGVTVEPIYLNWGTLNETYAGYFAAGDGPDILNLGSEFGPEYGDRLLPLNQYLKDWPDLQQYVPATLETVTWKDELRGLPWLTMPRLYMCRSDLLKESGVNDMPKTFEAAVQQAKAGTVVEAGALKRAGAFTNGAAGQELADWQEFLQFIWASGGDLYKADGTPNFDSSQARTALQFMVDRYNAVFPDPATASLGEVQGSRLGAGEVVCQWNNVWGAPALDDAAWQNIVVGPSPAPDGGKPVVTVFTDWLGIPAYTKNPELAVEFLKLLGSKENQAKYNQIFGSFSPRKDAEISNEIMKQQADIMAQYGKPFSDVRVASKLQEILQAQLPQVMQGTQDVDTTLQNIQQEYTQALKDAGRIQ